MAKEYNYPILPNKGKYSNIKNPKTCSWPVKIAIPVNNRIAPPTLVVVDIYFRKPLHQISTNIIKKFYKQLNGKIPIIGGGGVSSGKSAYEKIIAGASLLQFYTGFVYKGPSAAKDIKKELIQILKAEGIKNIKDAVGKGI